MSNIPSISLLTRTPFVLFRQKCFIFCTMIANKGKGLIYIIKSDCLVSNANSPNLLDGGYMFASGM